MKKEIILNRYPRIKKYFLWKPYYGDWNGNPVLCSGVVSIVLETLETDKIKQCKLIMSTYPIKGSKLVYLKQTNVFDYAKVSLADKKLEKALSKICSLQLSYALEVYVQKMELSRPQIYLKLEAVK